MRDALKAGLEFTAVFAGTDMVATGVLAALRESGLDVPGDVSIMGFDDVPFAADLSTSLTTLRVPYEDLGRTAVRLALDAERRAAGGDHVILGTQLVIRQSVRAPGEGRAGRAARGGEAGGDGGDGGRLRGDGCFLCTALGMDRNAIRSSDRTS